MATVLSCSDSFGTIGNHIALGKTVVYPTDTVYGLGSNPESEQGVRRCFELKKRESLKPLPVLFSSVTRLGDFVLIDRRADLLGRELWPGQLTLVLPLVRDDLPKQLTASRKELAVRIPDHECAAKLISACGGALIGTSANISGEVSFTDPEEPGLAELGSRADYFVKGKCSGFRAPSTVIDLTSAESSKLVREGAVPYSTVRRLLHEG